MPHDLNVYCYDMLSAYGWNGDETTVIWSHTHKPFEKITEAEKFPKLQLVNTCDWVIPNEDSPKIGASIILVSDANEVQSIRGYNDAEDGGDMKFFVSN